MISVRQIDLGPFSLADCCRLGRGPFAAVEVIARKLLGRPQSIEAVGACGEDVTRLEERLIPAPLRKACREVEGECEEGGLRFLFYYGYPPLLGGVDLGAAFLSADGRTAAFLHYCEARWPPTYFYCVSCLEGG